MSFFQQDFRKMMYFDKLFKLSCFSKFQNFLLVNITREFTLSKQKVIYSIHTLSHAPFLSEAFKVKTFDDFS